MACPRRYLTCFRLFSSKNSGNNDAHFAFNPKQPIIWADHFQKKSKEEKTKEAFMKCIEMFRLTRGKRGGGHVEFIEAASRNLESYGLHKDLDVYKALLNVFPKGELMPQNMFQRMFWHYPQQQLCAIDLLDLMEWHGVQSDKDLHDIVAAVFGDWNYATKKAKRQLYWLPKLKHTNKYLDRRLIEGKNLSKLQLAHIALRTMCRDAGTQLSSFKAFFTEEGPEYNNWIVSAQSPLQRRLVADLPRGSTCYVDGPSQVWIREQMLSYVVLSCSPTAEKDEEFIEMISAFRASSREELHKKLWSPCSEFKQNLHQQSDQTILAMAIFGVNSNEFASAWINHLQEENPRFSRLSVLFRLNIARGSLGMADQNGV